MLTAASDRPGEVVVVMPGATRPPVGPHWSVWADRRWPPWSITGGGGVRADVRPISDIVWRAWPCFPPSSPRPIPRSAGPCAASRDGAALDVTEAAVLLAARGDDAGRAARRRRPRPRRRAGRRPAARASSRTRARSSSRSPGCAATGATTARSPPCRGRLPARRSSSRDEVLAIARAGRRAGLQGGAVHPRRPARGPLARGAGVAGRARLRLHTGLRARDGDRGAGGDRAAAAPQPGRACRWAELQRLKPVAPRMGMMLETTSTRLWTEPGGPHYGSPDKEPAVRLRVLEDAGRVGVPFTTGILIGIGENLRRAGRVAASRCARPPGAYGHVQEVIVQNFRAKPDTAMRARPRRRRWTTSPRRSPSPGWCSARGCGMQAPPNLVRPRPSSALLLRAGDRRLGRGLAADPRPRQPGAAVAADRRAGRALGARPGSRCGSGSPRTRSTCSAGGAWLDPRLPPHVAALADPATGLAARGAAAGRAALAGAGRRVRRRSAAPTCTRAIDTEGRTDDRRADFDDGLRRLGRPARRGGRTRAAATPAVQRVRCLTRSGICDDAGTARADVRAGLALAARPGGAARPARRAWPWR